MAEASAASANWDQVTAKSEPGTPASIPPFQAIALHDVGGGMVEVVYLARSGVTERMTIRAASAPLRAFQNVLDEYAADLKGVAATGG